MCARTPPSGSGPLIDVVHTFHRGCHHDRLTDRQTDSPMSCQLVGNDGTKIIFMRLEPSKAQKKICIAWSQTKYTYLNDW